VRLAHDDEVDACSCALQMLNPPMNSWGAYELARRMPRKSAAQERKPQPAPPNPAPASVEWQALQEKRKNSS